MEREANGRPYDNEGRSKFKGLHETGKKIDDRIVELWGRERKIREAGLRPGAREDTADAFRDPRGDQSDDPYTPRHLIEAREMGMRAIEQHSGALSATAADRLDELLRERDPQGLGARYLSAVGNPHYKSAFGKMLIDPNHGHLRFSPAEVEAVRIVSAVESERALSVGTTTAGGFAIPFTLDPSILLSSAGVISPIRQLARQESIVTDVWKGVSSAGVTAAFAAEATEASDNAPVLAQPVIDTAKAFAFVPYSIEVGQDWSSLESELARLFADSKDVLEATAFLTGTGTDAPGGILNIGGTGGLTTTQRIQSATTNVYALSDVYSLKAALPARFVGAASWTQHPTNLDRAYRFVGGNSTEPLIMPTRDGNVLGIPTYEWSTMTATMATTNRIAIYGDFSKYLIADRIGGTVEIIPHLFGSGNRFPTGQRGAYYYWRVGGGTLVQNAFRYLEVL
jgi:HK97 family phage major capsid protein